MKTCERASANEGRATRRTRSSPDSSPWHSLLLLFFNICVFYNSIACILWLWKGWRAKAGRKVQNWNGWRIGWTLLGLDTSSVFNKTALSRLHGSPKLIHLMVKVVGNLAVVFKVPKHHLHLLMTSVWRLVKFCHRWTWPPPDGDDDLILNSMTHQGPTASVTTTTTGSGPRGVYVLEEICGKNVHLFFDNGAVGLNAISPRLVSKLGVKLYSYSTPSVVRFGKSGVSSSLLGVVDLVVKGPDTRFQPGPPVFNHPRQFSPCSRCLKCYPCPISIRIKNVKQWIQWKYNKNMMMLYKWRLGEVIFWLAGSFWSGWPNHILSPWSAQRGPFHSSDSRYIDGIHCKQYIRRRGVETPSQDHSWGNEPGPNRRQLGQAEVAG